MERLLKHLDVVVVDCQTSDASPATGRIIELAWARSNGLDAPTAVASLLIAPRDEAPLPRRITRITGLFDAEHTITATALESALLEVDEIQSLRPPYDRSLKEVADAVWYFSPGFDDASPIPGSLHSIGPFPGKEPVDGLLMVADLLSRGDNSAIWFDTATTEDSTGRLLVLSSGALLSADFAASETPIPNRPDGHPFVPESRAEYDELRVLVTELVRIVSEGREVRAALGPDTVIAGDRLRGILDGW
jgi:hypothetical protein